MLSTGPAGAGGNPAMNFIEYPDREMMDDQSRQQAGGRTHSFLMRHDTASFAVPPGGSTPAPMFDVLARPISTGTGST